jgi:hypothetical protein
MFNINFNVYQCFYEGCGAPIPIENIPPASSRPEDAVFWSQKEAWGFSIEGGYEAYGSFYGGGDYGPPTANTDVVIPAGEHIYCRGLLWKCHKQLYIIFMMLHAEL